MKNKNTFATLFSLLLLASCASNPAPNNDNQKTDSLVLESDSTTDNDRGFNPCNLNAELTICKKKQTSDTTK